MSRAIDETRPYTKEDIEYVLTLAGGKERVERNKEKFAHLSKKEQAEAQKQAEADDAAEAELQRKQEEAEKQAEEDSYHPDDVAKVDGATIKDLRLQLQKLKLNDKVSEKDKQDPEDPENPFTEKEVLTLRLLDYYDGIRNGTIEPAQEAGDEGTKSE
ncbi:hypothetical protein SEA_LILYPAD_13 [Gordonia phage LilyPad]|nr:hypothetical protein SEA_LILYPAD_13 [Gordonia phage LilyPad]